MDLREPRPKPQRKKSHPYCHLPIVEVENEIYKFTGCFNGFSVIINDQNEMKKLSSMGCFGKPNLSRGSLTQNNVPILRKRVFNERNKHNTATKQTAAQKKVIVVPDSDSDNEEYFTNLKPEYQIDSSGLKETLNLFLEEAFFLFYSVKCLNIYYCNRLQSEQQIWNLFCDTDKYFIQNYVVYHHFRSKNWVVKPGVKYGGDFLLYKEGPSFYHASYVVIVDVLDENTFERKRDFLRRSMKTTDVLGLNRVCETVGKELLICQLLWPSDLNTIQLEDLPKFKVNETIMRRWISSQNRELEESP